ncbi:scopoletin glucosyltransferase-like [Lolium perenne]|uniref:scopoletin glucosyltransferase-like n=1 Tax=Lolium perenne TaxID=4522 RepID=UPI0021EAD3CF|nr:scopoletin glucosyltransferase-like [Lolium perenne]
MAAKDEQQSPLHILFFPFLAPGHLIPMADMAALFASRGVSSTILTTPVNAAIIRSAIDRANDALLRGTGCPAIDIFIVPFPDVGLPPGAENAMAVTSQSDRGKFYQAVKQLREPFDRFLADSRPDAVVSDSFFDWSTDATTEHGVPRLAFLGSSVFARSCSDSMLRNNPAETAPDDPDALVSLPGLPHHVELRRCQMMDPAKRPEHWAMFQSLDAADQRSFGEVINSFRDLEPDYVEHYQRTLGRRAWLVGPVALAGKDMAVRGNTSAPSPDADSCLRWLDTKQPGSVVYVSFGTMTSFAPSELHQLARGLDLSGKNFVWVIAHSGPDSSEWMPKGFAELMERGDRGFIIRGWAPQMLILNHPALGGFVTHCGWNSTLEAVSAGVPMVTWPRYADQFYNEKLVVEVLNVGVSIGAKDYASAMETHEVIAGEVIAESIGRLMGGSHKSDTIQRRAKGLCVEARRAVENGGSSHNDVARLVDELMARRSRVKVGEDISTN